MPELQQLVDCHLARNATIGYEKASSEMGGCLLTQQGTRAHVRALESGFAVDVRADDSAAGQEIWRRAQLIASVGGEHVIEAVFESEGQAPEALSAASLAALPGVSAARAEAGGITLAVAAPHEILPRLLEEAGRHAARLSNLRIRHASLEDVFVNLTGRSLRDGESQSAA